MSATALPQPSATKASFASLLSSLTCASKPDSEPWDLTDLADDVATFSYEQGLRGYRASAGEPPASISDSLDPNPVAVVPGPGAASLPELKDRKTASVTLRISAAERTQLEQRAAEAQLSVSAYLRSCIFEAEALRDQVKAALLQMRAVNNPQPHPADALNSAPAHRSGFHFFQRWMPKPKSTA